MTARKATFTASDPRVGMTGADLLDALKSADPNALPRVKTFAAFHSDGGRIKQLTVEEEA